MATVYTVGHSIVPVEALLDAIKLRGIEALWDVRRYPMSRRHPQFNRDALARSLADHGIDYRHVPELGGRRDPAPDSTNTGLRNEGFRGYADYMATRAFSTVLDELIEAGAERHVSIMCAEAVPWRCHRSLISDALLARGVPVQHIIGASTKPHSITATARIDEERVTYPSLI